MNNARTINYILRTTKTSMQQEENESKPILSIPKEEETTNEIKIVKQTQGENIGIEISQWLDYNGFAHYVIYSSIETYFKTVSLPRCNEKSIGTCKEFTNHMIRFITVRFFEFMLL